MIQSSHAAPGRKILRAVCGIHVGTIKLNTRTIGCFSFLCPDQNGDPTRALMTHPNDSPRRACSNPLDDVKNSRNVFITSTSSIPPIGPRPSAVRLQDKVMRCEVKPKMWFAHLLSASALPPGLCFCICISAHSVPKMKEEQKKCFRRP